MSVAGAVLAISLAKWQAGAARVLCLDHCLTTRGTLHTGIPCWYAQGFFYVQGSWG